ncbi:MAG: response regulator, partial [Candidatus Poribacteria bacterium]|nr:response regulator [Candidatus Poribacteria bacterium]
MKAEILIVDDIPANLNILRQTLESEGYEIIPATSGAIALRLAAQTQPSLILLDIIMPGIDGFETCRRLKADEATADIPVIFITAKDEMESLVEGFRVGGVDYITKPFKEEDVLVRVRNHLRIGQLTNMLLETNIELAQANRQLQQEIAQREQAEAARDQAEDARQIADEQLSMISQREAERWGIKGFIGKSQTIAKILTDVNRLQNVAAGSVLITGESGTGK